MCSSDLTHTHHSLSKHILFYNRTLPHGACRTFYRSRSGLHTKGGIKLGGIHETTLKEYRGLRRTWLGYCSYILLPGQSIWDMLVDRGGRADLGIQCRFWKTYRAHCFCCCSCAAYTYRTHPTTKPVGLMNTRYRSYSYSASVLSASPSLHGRVARSHPCASWVPGFVPLGRSDWRRACRPPRSHPGPPPSWRSEEHKPGRHRSHPKSYLSEGVCVPVRLGFLIGC